MLNPVSFNFIDGLYKNTLLPEISASTVRSMKMHVIAKSLLSTSNDDPSDERIQTLRRIHYLSEKKLQFFNSSRLNFIRKFFSALSNLFYLGKFQSSAYLAKIESAKLLQKLLENRLEEVLPENVESEASTFDEVTNDAISENIAVALEPEQKVEVVAGVTPQLTLKESSLLTLENFWSVECTNRNTLTKILTGLLKSVEVVSFIPVEDEPGHYNVVYDEEKYADYYGARVTIKTQMEIILAETTDKMIVKIIPGEGRGIFCKIALANMRLDGVELAKKSLPILEDNPVKMIIGNSYLIKSKTYPAKKMIITSNDLHWRSHVQ